MFSKKKSAEADEQHALAYRLALNNIRSLIYSYCDRGGDKRDILNLMIKVVRQDLVSSKLAKVFYIGEYPRDHSCRIPLTGIVQNIKQEMIDVTNIDVITDAYQQNKLIGAVKDVCGGGFHQKMAKYDGVYYPEIELAIISNGIHHSAIAKTHGEKFSIKVDILPLSAGYGRLKTDGHKWLLPNGTELKVSDYRLALLFTLAEMRDWEG